MGRLANKTAIITGATGGIGSATAAKFLADGANVMLAGRDLARLQATKEKLGGGDMIACCAGQPAEEKDVEALIKATVAAFGGVDIMVANAGSEGKVCPLTLTSVEDFDAVQIANIRGTFLAIKHGALAMMEKGGSIIAMSSVTGTVGVAGIGPYTASKHGIVGLVKAAAAELAAAHIRVNAVAPAPIDNAMMASIEGQASPDDPSAARAGFSALIPMGRYGTNEEVANIVTFLASDEASFCTGGNYPVDGGFLAL
ncbi:SDR family NAD(P)-dependent oxidoreductase [Sphingorhabdus arenilitoris]|uniref:SDR family NAD(P)-dependent oxidoreductase n=1 Tax=Sphingorhabdus arenilitoris TaxID=1490041 RepID=A0ABV8RHY5_9SPHN